MADKMKMKTYALGIQRRELLLENSAMKSAVRKMMLSGALIGTQHRETMITYCFRTPEARKEAYMKLKSAGFKYLYIIVKPVCFYNTEAVTDEDD